MSNINLVKELRAITGAGFADCKLALDNSDNDIEGARLWLRKRGAKIANKRSDAASLEGAVVVCNSDKGVSMLEVNTETDFVPMNGMFQKIAACFAIENVYNSPEELLKHKISNSDKTVADELDELIAAIAERIIIKRCIYIPKESGKNTVFSYVHNKYKLDTDVEIPAGVAFGRSASVVNASADVTAELGDNLAMHIVANEPVAVDIYGVDKAEVDQELELINSDESLCKKPADIKEKIIQGRLDKFYATKVMIMQPWVMDDSVLCRDALGSSKILSFAHYKLPNK